MKNISQLLSSVVLTQMLVSTVIGSAIVTNTASVRAQEDSGKFACGTSYDEKLNKRVPTTLFWSGTGNKKAVIQWTKQINKDWTPQKRCEAFSQRIQSIYEASPDRVLYFTTGKTGGSKTICATDRVNGSCKQLLMTLRPGDNALSFLQEFKDAMNGESVTSPIQHSSNDPQLTVIIDMKSILNSAAKSN